MNLAVKLYSTDTNPLGIPGVWPSQVNDIGESTTLPDGSWVLMTVSEYETYKSIHQSAYDAWYLVYMATLPVNVSQPQTVVVQTPLDTDGSPLQRLKLAPTGWTVQNHCFELVTSKIGSIYSKKSDGTDYNFTTLKFYEGSAGSETLISGDNLNQTYLDANCTKTLVDWEPNHDYGIISGEIRITNPIAVDVRTWVVAVPDIAAPAGSKELLTGGQNLKGKVEITLDGRVVKYMAYNATYHTNKIRMVFRHPTGYQAVLEGCVDFYKA